MKRQRISGMPRRCLNTNCLTSFTKESHKGYLPLSTLEVFALMQCPKCKAMFRIEQQIYMAHEYFKKLPKDENAIPQTMPPITLDESKKASKWLQTTANPMEKLFDGPRPDRNE
jgi:hypothetical protein